MNQSERTLLESIATARSEIETVVRQQVDVLRRPDDAGWEASLGAAVTLPLSGAAAVLLGLAHVTLASTDEAEWDRIFSKGPPPAAPEPPAQPT